MTWQQDSAWDWEPLGGFGSAVELGLGAYNLYNRFFGGNGNGNGTAQQRRDEAMLYDIIESARGQGTGGDPYRGSGPGFDFYDLVPGGQTRTNGNGTRNLCRTQRSMRFGGVVPQMFHETYCGNIRPNRVTQVVSPDGDLAFFVDAGQPKTWSKVTIKKRRCHHRKR